MNIKKNKKLFKPFIISTFSRIDLISKNLNSRVALGLTDEEMVLIGEDILWDIMPVYIKSMRKCVKAYVRERSKL